MVQLSSTYNVKIKTYNFLKVYCMKKCYLAIDLGATSGRGIVGYMENGKL